MSEIAVQKQMNEMERDNLALKISNGVLIACTLASPALMANTWDFVTEGGWSLMVKYSGCSSTNWAHSNSVKSTWGNNGNISAIWIFLRLNLHKSPCGNPSRTGRNYEFYQVYETYVSHSSDKKFFSGGPLIEMKMALGYL